mgnify:CR=1 FL=1
MRRQFLKRRRPGFTLVELLVVVLIITILATIVLVAMFSATETARAARTRSMIARINDLLVPIWENYRTRRVPLLMTDSNPSTAAATRLDALRALMRMELPERKTDVEDGSGIAGLARPALSHAYQRQVIARAGSFGDWSEANQGSECLYLILSRIQDGDTNGLEFFRETEIGDVDNDGMPEILDGWGKPIAFLRWAPGFVPANSAATAYQDGTSPDPFDPLGVLGTPPKTFYLFPLVFSAGPDGEYAISTNSDPAGFQYSTTSPPNDPFTTTVTPTKFGTPDTTAGTFADNIHNHLQSTGE